MYCKIKILKITIFKFVQTYIQNKEIRNSSFNNITDISLCKYVIKIVLLIIMVLQRLIF